MRYTVYGDQYLYGLLAQGNTPQHLMATGGRYLVRGRVVDQTGTPVDGAAISISGQIVFSDSQADSLSGRAAQSAAGPRGPRSIRRARNMAGYQRRPQPHRTQNHSRW
jgi:hypothetical protein